MLAPHSVVRSNFLKLHEIIACQALHDPLGAGLRVPHFVAIFPSNIVEPSPPTDVMSIGGSLLRTVSSVTWGYRRNSGGRRKLSPRASRRAAEDFSSVEPLSPMAPPDALAAASYGCSAVCLTSCGGFKLRSIGDNRSTKKPNSVEPLSPMALHDAQRRRLTAVWF